MIPKLSSRGVRFPPTFSTRQGCAARGLSHGLGPRLASAARLSSPLRRRADVEHLWQLACSSSTDTSQEMGDEMGAACPNRVVSGASATYVFVSVQKPPCRVRAPCTPSHLAPQWIWCLACAFVVLHFVDCRPKRLLVASPHMLIVGLPGSSAARDQLPIHVSKKNSPPAHKS